MTTRRLPDGFFLGTAMSGPQTEGAWRLGRRLPSVWDTWSMESIEDFHNLVGSYVGNDFWHRYEEDFRLLKSIGMESVRTSIQWSRLLDRNGEINPEGAAFYHRVIAAAEEAGIELFVNLYHFDMPAHLAARGGWESREVVEAYARYARAAFREFGGEVRCWFTFNEPVVEPENCYSLGIWTPFVRDFGRARAVQYHISLAHSLAVAAFREAKAAGELRSDAVIGLICNFAPPYTRPDPTDADLEALAGADGIQNRWWLDLATEGRLPEDAVLRLRDLGCELPARAGDDAVLAQGVVDWIGCNYYHPLRIQAPSRPVDDDGQPLLYEPYVWPEARMNESRGWEIYPRALYDFGMRLARDYPRLPWFVSENGIGIEREYEHRGADGRIEDPYRVEFVAGHLAWLLKAVEEGSRCLGYHYWAVIDNWSWANAYKNRYGFVEVDLQDGYRRRPKRSADWLRELARTRTLETDEI